MLQRQLIAKRASQKLNRPGEARPILGRQRAATAAKPKVTGGATTATIKKKETMKTDARHRDIIKNKPNAPRTKQKLDPVKDRDEIRYKVKQMHQAAEKNPVLKAKIDAKRAEVMKRRKDAALKNKFAGGGKPKPTTLAASLNVNFGQILQEKYEIEVELLEELGMLTSA